MCVCVFVCMCVCEEGMGLRCDAAWCESGDTRAVSHSSTRPGESGGTLTCSAGMAARCSGSWPFIPRSRPSRCFASNRPDCPRHRVALAAPRLNGIHALTHPHPLYHISACHSNASFHPLKSALFTSPQRPAACAARWRPFTVCRPKSAHFHHLARTTCLPCPPPLTHSQA
jgi:hypothetical protein